MCPNGSDPILKAGHSNLYPSCGLVFYFVRCHLLLKARLPSHVFGGPNDLSSDLCPVNARIHGLVHQAADHNVVASDHVQSMRCFRALFRIVLRPDHAFDGILEDEVGDLVARHECAY